MLLLLCNASKTQSCNKPTGTSLPAAFHPKARQCLVTDPPLGSCAETNRRATRTFQKLPLPLSWEERGVCDHKQAEKNDKLMSHGQNLSNKNVLL